MDHSFNVDQLCFFLIRCFLTKRSQAVRVGSSLSSWKQVNGGNPQGKKSRINALYCHGNVDDTTAFEIIPRNSFSMLDVVVRETMTIVLKKRLKLNPKKCREMYVNFMKNSITAMRPISVGNQGVERVGSYKLLRVTISDDLKWKAHVEYVTDKAAKRLYALR